ncbi:uncharacterized protein [Rutidosis leptorrhynchoides]|uniref:uncharacterized protein n=1 Tax=Rutidosis leptorrhynchoides TaxID=125765 RepID=UPI003A996E50
MAASRQWLLLYGHFKLHPKRKIDKYCSTTTRSYKRNKLLPHKIGIFIWRAKMGRLPVQLELDKRGIDMDTVLCLVCNTEPESVDHLMRSCTFAGDIWSRTFSWWKNDSHHYSDCTDMLNCIRSNSSVTSNLWQAIEWVVGYLLWENRNSKIFGKNYMSVPVLFNDIQVKSFQWISNRSKKLSLDWNHWLLNPGLDDDHG